MTRESKRQVVETLVEKITIGKDDIEINLCYLPTGHHPPTDPINDDDNPTDPDDGILSKAEPISSRTAKACGFAKNMANRSTAVAG